MFRAPGEGVKVRVRVRVGVRVLQFLLMLSDSMLKM